MKRFRAFLFTAFFASGCMSTASAIGCEQPIPFDSRFNVIDYDD